MQIKTKAKKFIRDKNKIIAWGLVLPAVLVTVQVLCLGISGSLTTKATTFSPIIPRVLGESTVARGLQPPEQKMVVPSINNFDLEGISSKSVLIYDLSYPQDPIFQRSPEQKIPIASLTKLMTGLIAYENLDFGQKTVVSRKNLTNIRPVVDFAEGEQVLIGDVFNSMLVGSCNDAAEVLAKAVELKTGKRMVDLMNQKSSDLGMVNTSFSNPVGFDSQDNYSTANDLQRLIAKTQTYAAFTNLGRTESLAFKGESGFSYRVSSTNKLIKTHTDIQAIKTGFTAGARGAMINKILKNSHEIIIIVLGSNDREQDTLKLKKIIVDQLSWE